MKISYNWLKELTGVDWPVEKMAERLTLSGTACENITPTAQYMDKVVVGKVLDLKPIAGADKIQLATVDIGPETMDVVCGAPNVAVGQKVPVALLGARLAGDMEIKKVRIKGVESSGMICSERELGISDDHSGIIVLDPDARVGRPVAEQIHFDDYILDFELTPDRADSMSAIGIARDVAALAGVKVKKPGYDIKEASTPASEFISVKIDDADACPRYAARVIRNISIGESPWWIRQKLLTAGIRPISNVVDITNLIMLETGNPLHAFDLELFGSNEVVIRRARSKEKFTTLDGVEHALTSDVLLITNGKEGVAAGGVMGGLNSEVKDATHTVLLEAAYFNPRVIRKSRKELEIVTESSSRFEKGADPNNVTHAMNRAAYLFQEICGGEVLKGIVDCYPKKIDPITVELRPGRCNAVLGTGIPSKRMRTILNGLEFEVEGEDPFKVVVPTFRPDIEQEIDLIEEIVRIEGFDSVPDATENKGPLYAPRNPRDILDAELRHLLTGAGFDEIMGHGLADSRQAKWLDAGLPQVRIVNPVSEDLDIMRNSLALTALGVIQHNVAHRILNLRLFEIGKVYFPPDKEGNWVEEDRLMLTVTGETDGNWREKPRLLDFYDLKGALDTLAEHFHWPNLQFEETTVPYLDQRMSYNLKVDNTNLGVIGQLDEGVARKFDIKQQVFLAEISLSALISESTRVVEYTPLPVYPAAPRDLAIVVDKGVRVDDIISGVKQTAGAWAESVSVFDLYTGKQIESGKKSIGIAISYRSPERSLSSGEVDAIQQDVINKLKKDFKAEVRDK